MKKIYFSVFCLFLTTTIIAAENPTKIMADSTAKKSPLTINGSIDTYLFGNFNNPKSNSNLGAGAARAFDQKSGQFQVGLAQIKTTYSTDKVDGVIDLVFGNHADLANHGNFASPLGATVTSTSLAIKQAYLTWKATSQLSITAGQFASHVGYEVIDAGVNYNYSLSNVFNSQPFYHTGVKANYAVSDKFSLMAGLVNGIDSKDDFNKSKAFIAQAVILPKAGYGFYLNYITSEEAAGTYSLIDIVGNLQITPKFYAGLNVDFGSVGSNNWSGYALYTNYAFTDKFGLGARFDHVDNANAAVGILNRDGTGTTVTSFTLTSIITLSENLLLKPELRMDSYPTKGSGKEQFEDSNGNANYSSQTTLGAAFIFKF